MIRIFTAEKHRFLWDSILASYVYILRFVVVVVVVVVLGGGVSMSLLTS